jgi:hypothetical protein
VKITVHFTRTGTTEEQSRAISPAATVGWELKTKQKISDLANGLGIGDLVTLLYLQMKKDGDAPPTEQALLDDLEDIRPEIENPTSPPQAASPD